MFQEILNRIVKIVVKACAVSALLTFPTFGQATSKSFCEKADESVVARTIPVEYNRRESGESGCVFDFVESNRVNTSLRIEWYASPEQAEKEYLSDRRLYCYDENLDQDSACGTDNSLGGWSNSFVSRSKTNNLILLRKNRYVATMFSFRYESLEKLERLLDHFLAEQE